MRTSNTALRTTQSIPPGNGLDTRLPATPETFNKGFEPRSVRLPQSGNGHEVLSLRMYTFCGIRSGPNARRRLPSAQFKSFSGVACRDHLTPTLFKQMLQ